MTRRVAIVGAGPGGLASALLLAKAGAEVTIIERRDRVGGRTALLESQGFRFDLGPTFFLYPRILEEIFATCGRRLADEVDLIRVDPLYRLVFEGGGTLRATGDAAVMADRIGAISPDDAAALPRFLADNRTKLAAFRPVLERPFEGLTDLLAPPVLKALRHLHPWRSIDDDLSRYFRDPRIRLAFSFQSKYLGMSPFRCPSLFTILALLEYEYGVYHPRGGCGAVCTAMARIARQMGVTIRLEEPVEEILFQGRRAVGLRTPAGEIRADALVVNADFARAMMSLVPDRLRRRWTNAAIRRKRFSCSTFMLYLGIEGRYDHLDHHTILLARDYARNLAEIEQGRTLPATPSLYVQNACITDPSLAPPGHSTLYVLVPVGHRRKGLDWPAEKGRFRTRVLERLKLLGLDDLPGRIRFEQVVTPDDWDNGMNIHLGATFNLAHDLGQMLHKRPHNRFEDLDGVYLVGGGTHPGSGLPVIFEGARITSRLLARELGLPLAEEAIPGGSAWPRPAMGRAS